MAKLLDEFPEPSTLPLPGPPLHRLYGALSSADQMAQFVAGPLPARPHWRTSRDCPALRDSVAAGLFELKLHARLIRGQATSFPVMKGDGIHARMIVDPELNDRMSGPSPASGMPYIHDVLRLMSDHQYGVCLDAKSFFNQFYLAPDVRDYFTVRVYATAAGDRANICATPECRWAGHGASV